MSSTIHGYVFLKTEHYSVESSPYMHGLSEALHMLIMMDGPEGNVRVIVSLIGSRDGGGGVLVGGG